MLKFVISTAIIAAGLAAGMAARGITAGRACEAERTGAVISLLQRSALLIVNPFVTACAFWGLERNTRGIAALPALGLLALATGGVAGLGLSALLKQGPKRRGATLVSSSFTNIGNFGGLICFVFFGEASYALVSLYKLFEEAFYYLLGYPVAKWYGLRAKRGALAGDATSEGDGTARGGTLRSLARNAAAMVGDPYIAAYVVAIALGLAIRGLGIPRPAAIPALNSALIPLSSLMLVVSVGFRMRVAAIRKYRTECVGVAGIKFLLVPAVVVGVAALTGLDKTGEGLPFRVVAVLSAMPPAFNSLIPPALYGLDTDLANSCWLFCTASLIVVIPVLSLLVGR